MAAKGKEKKQQGLTRREFIKTVGATGMAAGMVSAFSITPSWGATLKPIVYGAALPLGDPTGVEARQGVTLAVEEINREGGIKLPDGKHPIELVVLDSRDLEPGVPTSEAIQTVERLILSNKVDFIVGGPERSEAWLQSSPLSLKYKKIMVAGPGCYSPAIGDTIATDPEGKYKYCWNTNNDSRTDVIRVMPLFKSFQEQYGWNKFFVMVQDVSHTRAAGEAVNGVLQKQMGWESLGFQRFPTGSSDFSLGLLEAKKKGAQLIFISMEMPQVGILLRQWHELKVPALPMGLMTAAQSAKFWDVSQAACEYALLNHTFAGNGPCKVLNPWTERYFMNFTKRWGVEPGLVPGLPSYTTAWAIKDAVERAGSIDSDAVAAALHKTDLEVPYGRLKFDPKRHSALVTDDPKTGMTTMWAQWQSKEVKVMGRQTRRVCVWPPAAATGKVIIPNWIK